jgi:hypothetical protein
MKRSAAKRFEEEVRWLGKILELDNDVLIARQMIKTSRISWWKTGLYLTSVYPDDQENTVVRVMWWMHHLYTLKFKRMKRANPEILLLSETFRMIRFHCRVEASKTKGGENWLNLTKETSLSVSQD